jgi:hypothetical protein
MCVLLHNCTELHTTTVLITVKFDEGDFHKKNYLPWISFTHNNRLLFFRALGPCGCCVPWVLTWWLCFLAVAMGFSPMWFQKQKLKKKNHFDSDLFNESTGNYSELSLPCLTHWGKHGECCGQNATATDYITFHIVRIQLSRFSGTDEL